jgi:hypothetical protein
MNIAAALQILLGALTTGLAASLTGRQVSLKVHAYDFTMDLLSRNSRFRLPSLFLVCIHVPYIRSFPEDHAPGGMSTLVASYLARARGLNEPELSNIRRKGLDQLIRDCRAFKLDHEDEFGTPRLNHELKVLRKRFEELLQNGDE